MRLAHGRPISSNRWWRRTKLQPPDFDTEDRARYNLDLFVRLADELRVARDEVEYSNAWLHHQGLADQYHRELSCPCNHLVDTHGHEGCGAVYMVDGRVVECTCLHNAADAAQQARDEVDLYYVDVP